MLKKLALVSFAFVLLLGGIMPVNAASQVIYTKKGHILRNIPLPEVQDCNVLQWRLQREDQRQYLMKSGEAMPTMAPEASSPASDNMGAVSNETAGGGAPATDFSTTNIQVEGVDEADVIKNDGQYIYIVKGKGVRIVKAYPAGQMEEVAIVRDTDTSFTAQEVYLADKHLVIIGSAYLDYPVSSKRLMAPGFAPGSSVTRVYVYDVSDKKNIKEERSVDIEGGYFTSRRIDNQVYLVLQQYSWGYPMPLSNTTTKGLTEQGLVPYIKDSATGTTEPVAKCGDITFFPGYRNPNFLIIASIPLESPRAKVKTRAYLGAADNVYASQDNLYITMTNYPYFGGPEVMIWPPVRKVFESTMVYKFALEKGLVDYQGAGEVPGTVLNQFSMDEHNGYFRVATTYGNLWSEGEDYARNNLFILDSSMDRVGEITDIAPHEKIYSVRFIGDRAYMVTFKNIDPLFVIDVKDPTSPKILGQLKIPGYSTYIHPYDANHIIGFGKDAVEDPTNKNFAWYQGLKVALFDVSDVKNPKQKFSTIIGDRGTDSELLYNHKALLFDKAKGIFAFPVTVAEIKDKQTATPGSYGDFVFQGAYVYNLNLTTGFTLKGRVTHYDDPSAFLKSGYYFGGGEESIKRALFMDDTLYTVSDAKVRANDLTDMRELKTIKLQAEPVQESWSSFR